MRGREKKKKKDTSKMSLSQFLAAVILLAHEALGCLQMCFMGGCPEWFEQIQSHHVSPCKWRREAEDRSDVHCWLWRCPMKPPIKWLLEAVTSPYVRYSQHLVLGTIANSHKNWNLPTSWRHKEGVHPLRGTPIKVQSFACTLMLAQWFCQYDSRATRS